MTCKLNGFYNVLSTSYKAYYSPPYGGGAGGRALWAFGFAFLIT
mgnify:CR=1 FL=1